MRSLIFGIFLCLVTTSFGGTVSLKEENDWFAYRHKDQYYTQGLLLSYRDDAEVFPNGTKKWSEYGLRNQFYTPKDIEISAPQPDTDHGRV